MLTSYDRPLTAGEVREILGDVVGEKEWTSWWTAARRHPQLLASGKGLAPELLLGFLGRRRAGRRRERFHDAKPADRLALYRKNAARDPQLRQMMETELIHEAQGVAGEHPERAMAIWGELDRLGAAPADADWSPRALLAAAERPAELILQLADRNLRSTTVTLLRELRDDWAELYSELLTREQDPRVLDLLAAGRARQAPRPPRRLRRSHPQRTTQAAGSAGVARRDARTTISSCGRGRRSSSCSTCWSPIAILRSRPCGRG